MGKDKWLSQKVMADEYGHPPTKADTPLTLITRARMFEKRNTNPREISRVWNVMKKQGLDKTDFNNDLLFNRNKGVYYTKKENKI